MRVAHQRKVIRHAIVALLTNATVAGARVQGTKVKTYRPVELPAIAVYTLHEPVQDVDTDTAPPESTRVTEVQVIAWVKLDADAADPMDPVDDICEQIETAMDANRFLGGEAADVTLTDTEIDILKEDGADPLVGRATLTYAVTYRTQPADSVLDDFLRAKATHQLADGLPGDTIPAADGPFTVQETP